MYTSKRYLFGTVTLLRPPKFSHIRHAFLFQKERNRAGPRVLGMPQNLTRIKEYRLLSWDVESTKCNLVGLETVCSSIDSSKEIESGRLFRVVNTPLRWMQGSHGSFHPPFCGRLIVATCICKLRMKLPLDMRFMKALFYCRPGAFNEVELLIQYSTENLAVEVLLNPHVSTLKQCLKNLLAANVGHKHVIHAGYAFTGSGSWVLQDGSFSHDDFVDTLQDVEVQRALRRHHGYTIHVHCIPEGPWAQQGEDEGALTKIYESLYINPAKQASVIPGSAILLNCLDSVLKFQPLTEMMKSSPVVGNIRFNRPTLYVFPGGQGDCALFGVSGFTMLIDGGFNRKPCFWEFIRHLDRLDAIMITRLNENNVCGITNVVRRKREGKRVYPQVGYVFCNVAEGKQSPTSPGSLDHDRDPLLVSVIQEGREFSENLQQLGLKPHRCLRDCQVEPLTLFHKVGHGTLEMYVLSPPKDSKEMKLFFQQWTSYKEHFSSRRYLEEREVPIPLSHAMSICALLVWKPADPADTITRVLLPGSAPQSKIFEGLEHLRHLEELKHRTCSQLSLGIKYEERVKVKTTKKHVIKTSATKQKADIVRPSSPIKAAREVDEQMKLQRKRAESPIKLQISSPVRKVKRSTKKVEEKKTASTKDEITIKKSISKDIKLVPKKIRKRTRSKEKRLISEDEKRDIGAKDEEIAELQEDEIISVETESLPKIEDEKTGDKEPLKIEDVEPDMHEEEKILLETKEHEKTLKSPASPEDKHVPLEKQEEAEVDKDLEIVPEKEKEDVREPLESEKDKSPVQEVQPKTEKEISEPVESIQELPDTKTPIEEQKEVEHIISEPPVQDEVKKTPLPVEKTKTPSPEKEKDVELKITQQKVSKKKLISKTTPSTRTALPSPDILRLRKEPEARKIPVKKEKVMEKESRVKPTTKTAKSISKPTGAQSPIERTPTPPSKFIAKTKEPTKPRTIKASPPIRTTPKLDMKSIKIPSVSEIKTKTAKDVVNKRVAESKVLAKQLELVKSKSPATPPKSPMKKPKEKLPIASPKKKPKLPTTAPTRISKPSKDKVKPKPVKRPEKIKEIIPSGSEEIKKAEQEEKGPTVPDDEHIPSQLSTPVEKTVEEMVQSVPSSPKDIQPEIEDITQDIIDKTPSEVLEQELEQVKETPVISEPKEIETPEEKAKETEIYDEQMVVKEIEAVEAAVDELIEGMRTEIEEAKVKIPSDADDSLQITEQERQDIEPQEKEETAVLKEDIGAPLGEESAIEDLRILDLTQEMDITIFNKLKEALQPLIQEELSFINDYIKNEGVSVKDNEKIIFEVTFEVLRKIQETLPIEMATKYINERKVEIASIICSKHKMEDISKPIEKESETISSKTPSPAEEIVEEIPTPKKVHINADQYQTPESKIEISTLANEIKKETKVENLEDIIAQVVCECLQSKAITLTKENFKNFIVEYKTEIITIIRKKYLPKLEVEKDEELKEKEELTKTEVSITKEEGKPSPESIKKCLSAKGKEEINKLLEDIKREGIAHDDLENIIYEIISSELQNKNLTVKEDIIIIYIIEYRTEIINKIRSKYVPVLKEVEEKEITEPEVIHVNIEQYLSPESKIEISSLANEVKKEINTDNLEQKIAEEEEKVPEKDEKLPTEKEEISTKDTEIPEIGEKVPIEKTEILDEEKPIEEEKVLIEKEEIPSEEEQIIEAKEKLPIEKKELLDEEEKTPEDEEVPRKKEEVPSEDVYIPEEKEKMPTEKDVSIQKEEEKPSQETIKKCLEAKGKEEINKLLEDIKREGIVHDDLENIIYEVISSDIQKKNLTVKEEIIILYIIEYRTEIINKIKSKYVPVLKEVEEKEITEPEVIHVNIEQYLSPESKTQISSLANEVKKEINIDNLEQTIAEIVYECLQNKSIILTKETFTKYIIEYRVEIITIIRKKYSHLRIEKEETPTEEEKVPTEKKELLVEEKMPKQDEQVPSEKEEITSEEQIPEEKEKVPSEKKELLDEKEKIPKEDEKVTSEKEKVPSEEVQVPEEKVRVPILKKVVDEKEKEPVKDEKVPREKEEISSKEMEIPEIKEKVPIEMKELLDEEEKVPIKIEKVPSEKDEVSSEELKIPEDKEKMPSEKEEIPIETVPVPEEVKILTEKEKSLTKKEKETPSLLLNKRCLTSRGKKVINELIEDIKIENVSSDVIENSLYEILTSNLEEKEVSITEDVIILYIMEYRTEIISQIQERYVTFVQEPVEDLIISEECVEERTRLANIMECITPEVRNVINDLAKDIQVQEEMLENTIEIILQTLSEEMQRMNISVESNSIIKYVTLHKKEIAEIVQNKLTIGEEIEEVIPVTQKITEIEIQEAEEAKDIAPKSKEKIPSPADDIEVPDTETPQIIDELTTEKEKEKISAVPKEVLQVTEKITAIEMQKPAEKDTITKDLKHKTPSDVDETKALEKEKPEKIDELIKQKEEEISSPTAETEEISPAVEKLTPIVTQEMEHKDIVEGLKKKTSTPAEEIKEITLGIPVTEKVKELEIQEPAKKEAITEVQKTKTPSPVDEIEAVPKEKEPSTITDEHITKKEDEKIPSPTEETKRISPVEEIETKMDIQETAQTETIVEGQKTKTPSPVDETKKEPKEKEKPQVIEEHITKKEDKTIPSPTAETERTATVTEKIEKMEIETITEDKKTKTPSPVDETKAESKEKQPSPVADEDKKITSPTEETERISPVAEKITELEIQEPEQEDGITKGQKSKTPSPVDELKVVLKEKETPQVIEEHITDKEDKTIPTPTAETKEISPVTEKIEKMETQEPVEKETTTEDQKTRTPSPVDEKKAEQKEKQPSPVIDEDKKIPSLIEEKEGISPVEEKITETEIQEPAAMEEIAEGEKLKTPSPVDETKAEQKEKELTLVIDEHITDIKDKKIPSPTAEKVIKSPLTEKITKIEVSEPEEKETITEDQKTKTPSPVDETKSEQLYTVIAEPIQKKEDKKIPSPIEETESISIVAETVTELEIQEPAEKETIAEGEDKKIPSPTAEMEGIAPVAKKVTELEIQEPTEMEAIAEGQKTKTPSPVDETKKEPKEKQTSPLVEKDKKIPSPTEETEKISS
ncbi:microtubule-associated protein futsch, partial [Trichonephila inaurata madagascariensis]